MLISIGLYKMLNNENIKDTLIFGTVSMPFSADPIDYDNIIHHYAFTSVFGKLVSIEKNAQIMPILAQSWEMSNNNQNWKFKFRTDLFYSDGSPITPLDYEKSLKRLMYLKKNKNSKSGILEFLKGYEAFNNINDSLEGIKSSKDTLEFNFIKPMPDFLSKISFGMYSLVHPSNYNSVNGEWRNDDKIISSGPYEISRWDKVNFELSLRNNLSFVEYSKRIKKIKFKEFVFLKTASEMHEIDIFVADKTSQMVDEQFEFVGSTLGLKIAYVYCYSWNKKDHPLNSREVRSWFRSKFYEGLEQNGLKPVNTFFPTNLKDVLPLTMPILKDRPMFNKFTLYTHDINISGKIIENNSKVSMADIYKAALKNLGKNSGAELVQNDDYEKYDLEITSTGIENDEYWDTVKFMFLSKEGINLPDETEVIIAELKKTNPSINLINKEINDQAIVWPFRHYTTGFWINKKSNLSYEELNMGSPALDFQFLKWN